MADLSTTFCGLPVKHPLGITSCDFGGTAKLIERYSKTGIGWIIGKTVHKIDGVHRWPRPFFYSLKHFGNDMKDAWICSQMFHNMPYEQWLDEELPKSLKAAKDHDVLYIGNVSGIGADPENWTPFIKDLQERGVEIIEINTGGPHATFGAIEEHKDCGAPVSMNPDMIYKVVKACTDIATVPIIVKTTPQNVNAAALAVAVEKAGGNAMSGCNAFYGAWIDHETAEFYGVPGSMGGLIGRPWQLFSLAKVLETTCTVPDMPFLGGGGVFSYDDIVRYIMAGSSLVGICSAPYSRGIKVIPKMIKELDEWCDKKGYKTIKDIPNITEKFMYLRDWKREGPYMQEKTPVIPVFDDDKCNRCGICEDLCPYGAITLDKAADTKPTIDRDICCGCGWCCGQCPQWAVKMVKADNGDVVWEGRGTIEDWVSDEEGY